MNEFDDLTDLDDVLGPLRSCAQPAELVGESAMVDLMVKAHRTPEEKHMFTSRRARIAALVAAGVLGFGGMAAAGSPDDPAFEDFITTFESGAEPELDESELDESELDESELEESELDESELEESELEESELDEPELEESELDEPELQEPELDEPASEEPLFEDDPLTDFNEEMCLLGNHGKTVSAVARGEFPAGVSVEMAAQSSCGKIDQLVEVEDETEMEPEIEGDSESEVEEVEKSEESEVKAERPGKGADGPGNGKSNGNNGNGKSNGNGKRGG